MHILKKNKRMIIGITIAVVLAVIISTISCYVLAETLINSRDVVYQDNSNLMADNVQEAIDGTCSKIDTRLSDIEDKLYTIKNMDNYITFTSSTSLAYTGVSITLPANSYCSITVRVGYSYGAPLELVLSDSSTRSTSSLGVISGDYANKNEAYFLPIVYSKHTTSEFTVYVWAKYGLVGTNAVSVDGFCATKYK